MIYLERTRYKIQKVVHHNGQDCFSPTVRHGSNVYLEFIKNVIDFIGTWYRYKKMCTSAAGVYG